MIGRPDTGTDERECPECRGKKGSTVGPFCDAPYEHESVDMCDCGGPAIFTPCRVCRGTGELDPIRMATYRARGGAAPVQRRGYA